MAIIIRSTWTQRRKLQRLSQRSNDARLIKRTLAMVWLLRERRVEDISRELVVARSSVYRWARWFEADGIAGLFRCRGGRAPVVVTDSLLAALNELLDDTPRQHGYLRSTWSSELLAMALQEIHGIVIHPSTVRRALRRSDFRWRRARPTLCMRDPAKADKLKAIQNALDNKDPYTEVFFVDEVDIDLNPRIGFTWSRRGHQCAVPTPGKNRKHYVAGALHAHSGRLVWVEHERKTTHLFINLLDALRRQYRRARRIVLVLDNYIIHKTGLVAQWLAVHPKFQLLFQPVYYPWVNQIERLWKAMHDTVTRNHRCTTLFELCQDIKRFFNAVQPFPGARHGVAKFGSAI
ncbi:MAG: IS630 family transposase [Gammaproteobacteria bacterium]|nr:IS630 family transposase [Gammaproteobacteria bacterium]